jgi:hypothetical protein
MANGYGIGGSTARYPESGYPVVNFMGAGLPGRSGVPTGTNGMGGGGARASVAAVNALLPSGLQNYHQIIAVVLVVGFGYALWHFTSKMS